MKAISAVLLAWIVCLGLATTGCETSHTESDTSTMMGGHKHEETTVTKNPITGQTTVTHEEQKTP